MKGKMTQHRSYGATGTIHRASTIFYRYALRLQLRRYTSPRRLSSIDNDLLRSEICLELAGVYVGGSNPQFA
jgi:hypothetical protein